MKRAAMVFSQVLLGLAAVASIEASAATSAAQIQTLGDNFETAGQGTFGFEFSVTEEVRVVRLGVFDGAGDGLASSALVTLWLDADPAGGHRGSAGRPLPLCVDSAGDAGARQSLRHQRVHRRRRSD